MLDRCEQEVEVHPLLALNNIRVGQQCQWVRFGNHSESMARLFFLPNSLGVDGGFVKIAIYLESSHPVSQRPVAAVSPAEFPRNVSSGSPTHPHFRNAPFLA